MEWARVAGGTSEQNVSAVRTRSGQKWAEVELQRTELSGLEWDSNGTRMGLEWDSNGTRMGLERDGAKWGPSKGYAADCKVQKYS
jgi:hypothetical protein